jgi:hypothetical protein
MGIKTVLEGAAKAVPLTLHALLETSLLTEEKKHPLDPDADWIRASGVGKLCPREEVLAAHHNVVRVWRQEASLKLIFLVGTALHAGFQKEALSSVGANILRGRWRCDDCGTLYGGGLSKADARAQSLVREGGLRLTEDERAALKRRNAAQRDPSALIASPTTPCAECGSQEGYTYREMWFGDPDLGCGGSLDGIIELPWRSTFGVLEMKSISGMGAWGVRVGPKPEHVDQATIYMMLTGLRWVLVLYIDKSAPGLASCIPHEIEYDPERAASLRARLRSAREGIRDVAAAVPPRICGTRSCARAKDCELSSQCFDLEEAP